MDNSTIIDQVVQVLRDECIDVIKHDNVTSLSNSMALAKARPPGTVCVVTNRKGIKTYDNNHPERIACILVSALHDSVGVIVNNREQDIESYVPAWLNKPRLIPGREEKPECVICMRDVWHRRKASTIPVRLCWTCHAIVCEQCENRIAMRELSGSKCPACRTWRLDGEQFGTPYELLQSPQQPKAITVCEPLVDLAQILASLDGCVMVYVKFKCNLVKDPLTFCRLAGTTRFAKGSDTTKEVVQYLEDIVSEFGPDLQDVSLYVQRKTWRIAEDVPVTEQALFEIKTNGRFQCVDPSCYRSLIDQDNMLMRSVVYGNSAAVWVPPQLPELLVAAMQKVAGIQFNKTFSVISVNDCEGYMNFDTDENNAPTSITEPQQRRLVHGILRHLSADFYVTVRVFYRKPAYMVFKCCWGDEGVVRMSSADAKAFYMSGKDKIVDRDVPRFPDA